MRVVAAVNDDTLADSGATREASIDAARTATAALAPIARDHELVVMVGRNPHHATVQRSGHPRHSAAYPLDQLFGADIGLDRGHSPRRSATRLQAGLCWHSSRRLSSTRSTLRSAARASPLAARTLDEHAKLLSDSCGLLFERTEVGGSRRLLAAPHPRAVLEAALIEFLLRA